MACRPASRLLVALAAATLPCAAAVRRVLVTGASRGCGRAIAKRFADAGDTVCIHYARDETSAAETRAMLNRASWLCPTLQAELGQEGAPAKLIEEATSESALGGIDVLVVNAAVYEE